MKLPFAEKHLINAYNKKTTTILWSPPGTGKSSLVKQVAKKLGIDLIDLRLPQLEPSDLRGIPVPNHETKRIDWYAPAYLTSKGNGILFLDEIEKAPVSVKNASLELILDRSLGAYSLPEGWSIVCAGNYEENGAVSQNL